MIEKSGLYTDLYELTMAQGHFMEARHLEPAVFDYFFRSNPFDGGYAIFAGLQDLLDVVEGWSYGREEIEYLGSIGFQESFLDYLSQCRFRGNIESVPEGEVVFPFEPVVRVEGTVLETQLLETLLLNVLNFQSLIATKASRIRAVAGDRSFADFGLRRAQGSGGTQASRAAAIGGADSTSNVHAAHLYGLDTTGTMAHSWIQSFGDELQAFRRYAAHNRDRCVLLVDTYNTLKSGVPNAITAGKELERQGHRLLGVRLDSGDLAYLSKKTRYLLDRAGLEYVKILASNQLDEYVIRSLTQQDAPIDGFGVGTELITGKPSAALDGVYKLCMYAERPALKISENIEKVTLPGVKQTCRTTDEAGHFAGDVIVLASGDRAGRMYHPFQPDKYTDIAGLTTDDLLQPVMKNGQQCTDPVPIGKIARYAKDRLALLPEEHRRFENPHIYKVGISEKLMALRDDLRAELTGKHIPDLQSIKANKG